MREYLYFGLFSRHNKISHILYHLAYFTIFLLSMNFWGGGIKKRKKNVTLFASWSPCIHPSLWPVEMVRTLVRGFPSGSAVKNLPAMQKTWVQSLGRENPLEEGIATHSSILAWKIPWAEEPGRLQSMGSYRAGHDWAHILVMTLSSRRRHSWWLTCPLIMHGHQKQMNEPREKWNWIMPKKHMISGLTAFWKP